MATLTLKRPMSEWRRPMGMNDLTQDETTAALHYANRMQRLGKYEEKALRLIDEGFCDTIQDAQGRWVNVIGEFSDYPADCY